MELETILTRRLTLYDLKASAWLLCRNEKRREMSSRENCRKPVQGSRLERPLPVWGVSMRIMGSDWILDIIKDELCSTS